MEEIKVLDIEKNDFLLQEGQKCFYLWFIIKGSARSFYHFKDDERTSWIYKENQIVTAIESYSDQSISITNIQATENLTVARISVAKLEELYVKFPSFQTFGRLWAQQILSDVAKAYQGFDFMSPKEKYDLLLYIFPDVTQRVNLGHIASFLGISRETLSRLRNPR